MDQNEYVARQMYDVYCKAVGGKAYNGDQLPHSEEFFSDENKKLQADGWRAAADTAIEIIESHDGATGDEL